MLLPPLLWLLRSIDPSRAYEVVPIDLRAMKRPPRALAEKVAHVASGAPKSTVALDLPDIPTIERRAGAKDRLHVALTAASETRGRRRARFRPEPRCHAVASSIKDWTPLLRVASFERLHTDLSDVLGA